MKDLVNQTLGRYKIISLLGEGGMGAVFKGEDPTLQRIVAVKVMHPHLARQPGFAERFLQEARSAARLDHPGIVKVYEFNQTDDLLFIVMEFIPGDNLRQMLQDLQSGGKWLTLAEAVDVSRQLALALDYAHRQGVLHRDIKPDNIMLKSATSADLTFQPVLTDLGLAKLREGGVQTEHGTSLGTPAYMSPEQAMGQPVDARSDVYSLGILPYELAVGRLPFAVKTISEAVAAHLQLSPPPPRSLRPDLPAALEQIILRALAKDPANRYPTAAAFADALAGSAPDVTLVAGAPPTLAASSLATQYQTSLLRPHGPSLMGGLPTPPGTGKDRLVIRGPDNSQRVFVIETTELTVGRSSNATIVLDDPKVSRSHAKITFDGARYRVLDLDSTNGTQLANARLLAGIPQEWTPEKPLRVGDHWLFLQRGDQQPAAHPELMNGTVVDVVMPEAHASQPVAIFIEPARLAVEAGGAATASLTLTNQGQVVDHLTVAVDGVPVSWLPATLPAARLMPGEQKTLTLTIAPPRSIESRAGDYPLTIRVASQSTSGQAAEIAATLSIAPYRQYQSQLKPEQLQAGASGQVVVQNQGNSDETYAITWSDRADELVFKPAQAQLTVPSGQANSAIYTAGPRKRRWVSGRRHHPFSVQVTPPQGPPQTPQGAVVSSGWMPPWLPPALVFLCLVLAAAAAFAVKQQPGIAKLAAATPTRSLIRIPASTWTPTRMATPAPTPTWTPLPPYTPMLLPALPDCQTCTDPKGCVTVRSKESIRIAWLFVVSGADASLGTDTQRGAEIAQANRPTVAGHTVELVGNDDGCNAEGGQAAGTKVASDSSIVAAIGTNCSSAARAAIPLLFAAGIPMVSPSNTAPDLTAEDRPAEYAFYMRTAHNDTIQGAAMAKFAIEAGYKNAATIHDGSLYADMLQQVFAEEFQKLGGTIVAQEATDPTETNMGPMLTRIAAAQPDFIYLPIFIAAGGQIVSQAKQNADLADVQLAGADGIFSPDFLAAAGDASEGFLWSSPDFSAFGGGYQDFLAQHQEKYGEAPLAPFHAHAYDAYNLIANAIEQAAVDCGDGSIQIGRQTLRNAMISTTDMRGLTGTLTCNSTGDCADTKIAVYELINSDPATWNPGASANSNPRKIWSNN